MDGFLSSAAKYELNNKVELVLIYSIADDFVWGWDYFDKKMLRSIIYFYFNNIV